MIIKTVEPKKYIKLRIFATLIDYGIYFTILFIYVYCYGHTNEDGIKEVSNSGVLPLIILWFLYFVVTEAINQSTPGHDICKLIVVKTSGDKVTISDAFKRRLLDPIDILMWGIPALICISNTPKFQRLGDLIADTLVVKKSDIVKTEIHF